MKKAFTLAEVLITLGIIGVVAAMTLPILIAKYRNNVLESQFKTAYSIISRATMQMYMENEGELSFFNNATFGEEGQNRQKYLSLIPKYYKIISKPSNSEFSNLTMSTSNNYKYNYKDNFLKNTAGTYILSNGMLFSHRIAYKGIERTNIISVTLDTNGPYKGPNRYGYDLFIFVIGKNGKISSSGSCSFNSTRDLVSTGEGCFLYALRNVSPDSSYRSYWKNLP